jgi:hypothetical protein
VLPKYEIELNADLPCDFGYWFPTPEDIEDTGGEGFGYFHDTWLLDDVEQAEARAAVAQEACLINAIDAVAHDATEFDVIASAAENGHPDDVEIVDIQQRPGWQALMSEFPAEDGIISNLELGVGGLSYALAAVGLLPVASCRSHPYAHSWSDVPVVLFAIDRPRAIVIQRLVVEHRCGLGSGGPERSEFMAIVAGDIRTMNALAAAVLDSADDFVPGR